MQYLLNVLWIKKGGYPFGNRDETISSALGRNRRLGTLTVLGRGIDAFLDRIDPQHSLNSIDYYTEPSEAVTDRVAWIHIEDNKLLFLKEKEHPAYVLPGGQRLAGASDAIQLCEYLEQLFGVLADPEGVEYIGTFESKDAVPAILLRQRCYTLPVSGSWHPADRIEALHWFGYADRSTLSANNQQVLEALRKKGLIG